MSTLLVWRELLQKYYAKYTKYINMALRFIMALFVFGLISHNIGFMEKLSSVLFTIAISVVSAFMPATFIVMAASIVVLLQVSSISIALVVVLGVVFLLMYIVYFRFTPSKSWLVLLTPVTFALNIPFVIPVTYGLIGKPVCTFPAVFGTIIYYMLNYVKGSASMYAGEDGMLLSEGIVTFVKQIISNKEMWVMASVMALTLLVVYNIRNRAIDRCWEIAIIAGAVTAIVTGTVCNIIFNLHFSYLAVFLSGCAAVIAGLIFEILFFSMDYTKTEYVQFEDDEYYYYVKAVPKICVSAPEKKIQHINERKTEEEEKPEEKEKPEEGMFATKCLTQELGLNNVEDK